MGGVRGERGGGAIWRKWRKITSVWPRALANLSTTQFARNTSHGECSLHYVIVICATPCTVSQGCRRPIVGDFRRDACRRDVFA